MCFKKLFKKEEPVVEEVVERKPVDKLVQGMNDLVAQLNLVVEDNRRLEGVIEQLQMEKQQEYENTCAAKDQIVELLNQIAELERRLDNIEELAKGGK